MSKFRILVTDGLAPEGLDLFRAEPRVEAAEMHALSPSQLLAEVASAHALVVRSRTRVTGEVLGIELSGKTLGIIGFGRVGRAVSERARAFGMKIRVHDPALPAESVPLADLLAESDVVTLHLPLLPSTEGLLDREAIERMKPGALLVNCARGGLVDEEALLEALRSGKLAGAALDVLREEPPPQEHPLLALDNVIATPHLGAATREAQARAARDIARQVLDFLLEGKV